MLELLGYYAVITDVRANDALHVDMVKYHFPGVYFLSDLFVFHCVLFNSECK